MKKITTLLNKLSTTHLIYLLSIIAGLFTWQVMAIRNDWINVDSILYFDSAKAILEGNWQKAYQIYNWPYYSALIALLAKLTGTEVFTAAKILNIVFFGITMLSLAKIVERITTDKLTLICFALLLLGSSYIAGSVLPMLLRDQGFWAFLSTAVLFLIKYLHHKKIRDALLWQSFITIATLFRIEGTAYLLILPLVAILNEENRRVALFDIFKLNILFFAFFICGILAAVFLNISTGTIGRLTEVNPMSLLSQITSTFSDRAKLMQDTLGEPLMHYSSLALGTSLLMIVLVKQVTAIKFPALLTYLIYYGDNQLRKPIFPRHINLTFLAVLVASTLTSLGTTFRVFVLSGRYVIPFVLFSLIIASAMLSHMIRRFKLIRWTQKLVLTIIVGVLVAQTIKNVWPKPPNYNYQKVAINYIFQSKINISDVTIFTKEANFYAQKDTSDMHLPCEGIDESVRKWNCLNSYLEKTPPATKYILIPITAHNKGESAFEFLTGKLQHYSIVKEFDNPRKDKMLVLIKKN